MRRSLFAAALILIAAPAATQARNRDLWVTVNICNTPSHPDMMGVRARMPGNGTREKMYMRFTAQFRAPDGTWKTVTGTGRSPWIYAGSALFTHQEEGFTFSIDKPSAGDRFVLRGVADFQWRARRHRNGKLVWVVVKSERLHTEAGHPSSGADPPGYSSAVCVIAAA